MQKNISGTIQFISQVIVASIILLLVLNGCTSIQKKIDNLSMKGIADDIQADFYPGDQEKLTDLLNNFSLKDYTEPVFLDSIETESLDKWKIDHPLGKSLIMEKISFPSLIEHRNGNDTAVFYIYRNGELKDRNVILWVPGMAVSDLAFFFIRNFFAEELKRDYDIVFYVPPYHLERTEPGRKNSEGFFTADTEKNVQNILNSVRELRTISEYLKEKNVRSISGWGGSIGASMLLLTSQMVELDHLSIMIPIINWETVIFENVYMKEIITRIKDTGISEDTLLKAYGLINPANYPLNINPVRTHVMYAEYDQLTPTSVILNYANKNNISSINSYQRSHATILLSRKMYTDYGRFLDTLHVPQGIDFHKPLPKKFNDNR